MLKENIKFGRKSKGLSQEELALKLHVVRQTISKWEQGESVPDSEMLVTISEVLEMPVSTLLGETVSEPNVNDLKVISEKLEVINLQLLQRKNRVRQVIHWGLISCCILLLILILALFLFHSFYFDWDYSNPETLVLGVTFHSFEWLFVRIAPILFVLFLIGIVMTRKKN